MNNRDSLRAQLIEAMTERLGAPMAESVFQLDLWPVLEAAMKSGELLVHRATVPQKPVAECITSWLIQCVSVIERIKAQEHTVSKATALKTLYLLAVSAEEACHDAKAVENMLSPPQLPNWQKQ